MLVWCAWMDGWMDMRDGGACRFIIYYPRLMYLGLFHPARYGWICT